ncbi:hypothetical protein ACHAW5_003100 [Stephanodiscus triporus]|uniref:Uncharacterized protein n=1 Tax=Stephanodiscus triporus TaxID=2934178 RepID=A0ABD3MD82_9STRA
MEVVSSEVGKERPTVYRTHGRRRRRRRSQRRIRRRNNDDELRCSHKYLYPPRRGGLSPRLRAHSGPVSGTGTAILASRRRPDHARERQCRIREHQLAWGAKRGRWGYSRTAAERGILPCHRSFAFGGK